MKPKIKTLFIIVLFTPMGLCAQNNLFGKILDFETRRPVSYANVTIGLTLGTASDENGSFVIDIISEVVGGQYINISCIGYGSARFSLDSLKALKKTNLIFFLKPQATILKEIVVSEKRISPDDVVRGSLKETEMNYIQSPFNMEFYSKIIVKDSAKTYYVVESIVDTYRKGYTEGAENYSKMIEKRETGECPLAPLYDKKRQVNYFSYENLPLFNIFLVDLIGSGRKYNYTVFNPDYFNKLSFGWLSSTIFDGDSVNVISYHPKGLKPKNELDRRDGILFISGKSQAILRHQRTIGKISLDVSYRQWGDHYFPYFIKSIYPVSEKGKSYGVILEIYVKKISTQNIRVYDKNSNKKDWHLSDVQYNSNYWESHYPIQGK